MTTGSSIRATKRSFKLKLHTTLTGIKLTVIGITDIIILCNCPYQTYPSQPMIINTLFFPRLKRLEREFFLDGVALSKLANDETGRTQPSLNMGIPQYSALGDPGCKHYFNSKSMPKVTKESVAKNGKKEDSHNQFIQNSEAQKYLDDRKKIGAGKPQLIYLRDFNVVNFV